MTRHQGLLVVSVIAFVISIGYNVLQYQNLQQLTSDNQQLHDAKADLRELFTSARAPLRACCHTR